MARWNSEGLAKVASALHALGGVGFDLWQRVDARFDPFAGSR
jgi:hypothetical protein